MEERQSRLKKSAKSKACSGGSCTSVLAAWSKHSPFERTQRGGKTTGLQEVYRPVVESRPQVASQFLTTWQTSTKPLQRPHKEHDCEDPGMRRMIYTPMIGT